MARAIDADVMLAELKPIDYEAEHSAVLISDVAKIMREWVERQPTLTPQNDPLTLEELREMDGEPVYMTFPSDTGNQCGHWALVGTQRWGAVSLIYGCGWSSYESAVETLGAEFYRRPPEGEVDNNG
nr:MAG TPA: hypothetical protein [Caudoviricetes sp.]